MSTDTIFALSSGAGRAGVAVIRVSGGNALAIGERLARTALTPRLATFAKLYDAKGDLLDQAVLLFFPNPKSFTGEHVLEIQCHGSPAVIAALLKTLSLEHNCRAAEAGEFTRRAFMNGKMDLTEIEGLSDLLSAQTDLQRRAALRDTAGVSRTLYTGWRAQLVQARALIEALIDFSEDEDIPAHVIDDVRILVQQLLDELRTHLENSRAAEVLRDGLAIVIAGPPNAGKSSLMNAIAKRDVAIVTDEAGTTRDVIEVHLDLDGAPVTLIDTAGLRETDNTIEREGIRRALARAETADLVLWLQAPGATRTVPDTFSKTLVWPVATKADLAKSDTPKNTISLSIKTGEGIGDLLHKMTAYAHEKLGLQNESTIFLRARHRQLLQGMMQQLEHLQKHMHATPVELLAEELRLCSEPLERIMGYVGADEMLGLIFSKFCIGK